MDDLHRQFYSEAEELLDNLFSALEQLRLRRAEGRVRRDLTARIFRYVHTLKGAAGSAEMQPIRELAHEFESALDAVRLGRIPVDDRLLDAFEDAAYSISEELVTPGDKPTAANKSELLQRLRDFAASGREGKSQFPMDARSLLPGDIAAALSRYDERHLAEALAEGARLFIVSANFPIAVFDQKFRELSARLAEQGEILATVPGAHAAESGVINFRLLYATASNSPELTRDTAETHDVTATELKLDPGPASSIPTEATNLSPGGGSIATLAPSIDTVRVSLLELDDLISRASELFRETINAFEKRERESDPGGTSSANTPAIARIREQFVELENRLIKLRMVPLAATFERAARAGRLAARATGRDVTVEISGGDVAIDKFLAATIADPLMHLVRNAVDHGIEMPEERLALGKNRSGRVRLSALAESNRVEIYVGDDGRGIDPARIGRAAAEREIIADAASVTFDQCLRLIFRPGFSTADVVSETSGRGIGLEIVDQAMANAGGEVRVRTEPGKGTTFQMILPATLALVSTLLVRAGDSLYHIDSRCVVDRQAGDPALTEDNDGKVQMRWRDQLVPCLDLKALFAETNGASNGEGSSKAKSVVIVRQSGKANQPALETEPALIDDHVALLVDSIEGEHQALVRSLGRYAARWHGVAGANELADGSVALVLDVPQLLEAHQQ
jgi:two-component system chemotaxis sensor kinase CheA